MATYTSQKTVVFLHAFKLAESGETYPAGRYDVEVDEETIDDLSFPTRRRVATILYVQDPSSGASQAVRVDPEALEAALRADAAQAAPEERESLSPSAPADAPLPAGGERQPKSAGLFVPPLVIPVIVALAVALAALFGPFDLPGTDIPGASADNGQVGQP